jgi:hypothetical protein
MHKFLKQLSKGYLGGTTSKDEMDKKYMVGKSTRTALI